MNITDVSLSSSTLLSGEVIVVPSTSLAMTDVSPDDRVNMIEADDNSENCTTGDAAIELTPYPYSPTSEEVADYYQLEQSLGEDWSFRLACELSCDSVLMDDDDDDFQSLNDDSVMFIDDRLYHDKENISAALPEDIEVRAYMRRETFFDETITSVDFLSNTKASNRQMDDLDY